MYWVQDLPKEAKQGKHTSHTALQCPLSKVITALGKWLEVLAHKAFSAIVAKTRGKRLFIHKEAVQLESPKSWNPQCLP